MSNLIPHVFNDISIRTTEINGQIWFVANDVCQALNIANPRDAIKKLDDDEKGVALTDTAGGNQQLNIINESGLYVLILRSRDAMKQGSVPHQFRKWVTAEVLPSIRKTGSYQSPQMTEDQLMHWHWTTEHYSGKIGHDQAEMLHFLMRRWIEQSGLQQQTAYHNFHTHMGVGRTDYILRQDFKKAMTYLHLKTGQINHGATDYVPAPQTLPAIRATQFDPYNTPVDYLSEREHRALRAILHHFEELNILVHNLQRPLEQLGYPHSADLYDHRHIVKAQCSILKRFA